VIKDLRGTPYSLSPISSEYIVCPFLVCLPLQIFDSVIKDLKGTPYSLSRGAGAGNSCDQLQSVTVSYYQLLLPRRLAVAWRRRRFARESRDSLSAIRRREAGRERRGS